ncbi:polysaccharide deacetylase family protein [Litorimonas taeanensis]
MDDFSLSFDKVLTPLERNARILSAFDRFSHKAAGFVSGKFVEHELGDRVLKTWQEAGHVIGNHSYSHLNSSSEDHELIKADILKNHERLKSYSAYEKYFRFPFLAEGGNSEKIEIYRTFLRANGFLPAPVTIDSIDWYTASRFEKRLSENPKMGVSTYKKYYVEMVVKLSRHFQNLAEKISHGDIPHILLMHHNILNGLFLGDVLQALSDDGWEFVDADKALSHSFYQVQPSTPIRGRSLLSVLAMETGISDTGYPDAYYGFGEKTMDALGL